MEANQSHPGNGSDETERVSSDKLALMLEERGILVPGRPVSPTSTTSSGATNPFTSRGLEDMRRQGRIGPAAPGNDPWVDTARGWIVMDTGNDMLRSSTLDEVASKTQT